MVTQLKPRVVYLILVIWILNLSESNGFITWIAPRLWLQTPPSPPGSPWPLPQQYSPSRDLLTFSPDSFTMTTNFIDCDVIDSAIERYSSWLYLDPNAAADPDLTLLDGLQITVRETGTCAPGLYPQDGMDETYELDVSLNETNNRALLTSNTVWGALRGLETFSQLIYLSDESTYLLNETVITDFPRFSYRGYMIDSARHYLPLHLIETIIQAMSWDKLNVLHWHIVDDQAFTYESTTYPEMSLYGAYTPAHTYNQTAVRHVIDFARLHGIRVIPEFDTPGHTYSWGKGLPDLLTPCWGDGEEGGPYVPKWGEHADMETINPSQEYSYEVMTNLWQEVFGVFPDEFVHLGLDEAYYRCWQSNPNISAWMVEMGFTEYNQVEEYYTLRLTGIARELGAKVITWQDPLDNNVTLDLDNTRIGVWKDDKMGAPGQFLDWRVYMERITALGYSTYLLAPWYLNIISYGQDWREYYETEPFNFTNDPLLHSRVLGGSATSWAEYIDATNLLDVIWPRLSAVAERLWSAQDVRDTNEAAYRLDQQRCRFISRGVNAKPLMPGYCGIYDGIPL